MKEYKFTLAAAGLGDVVRLPDNAMIVGIIPAKDEFEENFVVYLVPIEKNKVNHSRSEDLE